MLQKALSKVDRFHQGFQFGDLVGECRSEVASLAEICFEIVELVDLLALFIDGISVEKCFGLEVFPFPLPDPGVVEIEMLPTGLAFAEERAIRSEKK